MKTSLIAPILLTVAASACGALRTESIDYQIGGVPFQGYLAYDDATKEKRPGVLVIPEWWGLNDYAKRRANMLAELGYVAFAADMYGRDKVTTDPAKAGGWAGEVRADRSKALARVNAALDVLRNNPLVDTGRLGAIGYCFGGTMVLEAARSGSDLRGVVSFHGTLATTAPAEKGAVKAKILVLTGADDPSVPLEQVTAFQEEMRKARTDWQIVTYADAVHSFTNPDSSKLGMKGVGYNEAADRRSWRAMMDFFSEVFANTNSTP